MNFTLSHPEIATLYKFPKVKTSYFRSFSKWAANEDLEHHVGWLGVSIMVMTAFVFPLTMAAILFNGAAFGLICIAMLSLIMVFIVNLAALSTRYTIPFLFAGILIDFIVITISAF